MESPLGARPSYNGWLACAEPRTHPSATKAGDDSARRLTPLFVATCATDRAAATRRRERPVRGPALPRLQEPLMCLLSARSREQSLEQQRSTSTTTTAGCHANRGRSTDVAAGGHDEGQLRTCHGIRPPLPVRAPTDQKPTSNSASVALRLPPTALWSGHGRHLHRRTKGLQCDCVSVAAAARLVVQPPASSPPGAAGAQPRSPTSTYSRSSAPVYS